MCEKIREGKVLSLSSDGDIDESFPDYVRQNTKMLKSWII